MLLADKVTVVTGAARGTGAAIARRFAVEGATVVVVDVDDAGGTATAEALGDRGWFARLDVTDGSGWAELVARVLDDVGRIDVLVNNAAVLHIGGIADTDGATLRRVLDVNLVGAHLGK